MPPSRSTQAIAIWARVWPRRSAMALSARMCSMARSLRNSWRSDLPWVARLPSGMPFRYFAVSMPWASGVKAIEPMPRSFRVSFRPSRSTQRLIML